MLQVFHIGGEKDQSAQACRTDGVALGHGLGRVADRVQGVGGDAHLGRQTGHFGDAAGIVGDRTERVERNDESGKGQHRRGGDGDPEQARQVEGDDDADDDDQGRSRGGLQRHGQTLDHVGAVARNGCLGHRFDRAEIGAGVVFGDHHDQRRDDEAGHGAGEQSARTEHSLADHQVLSDQGRDQEIQRHRRQQAGDDEALIQGPHDRTLLA